MKVKNRISGIIIAAIFFFFGFVAHGYFPQGEVKCPENIEELSSMCLTKAKTAAIEDEQRNEFFVSYLSSGSLAGFPLP